MSNGHANCILEVCCPPDSPQQISALAEEMAKDLGWSADKTEDREGLAYSAAAWVIRYFDLAPKGSLSNLKAQIAALAREGYVKAE